MNEARKPKLIKNADRRDENSEFMRRYEDSLLHVLIKRNPERARQIIEKLVRRDELKVA